ncbi:hypothetical protein PO124_21685 [Bacillus licheniformis]|nr:hypothetical protein [Bacillus licheniformis]
MTISYLSASYWQKKFTGVRRLTTCPCQKSDCIRSHQAYRRSRLSKGGTSPKEGFDTAGFIQYVYKRRQEWSFRGMLTNNTARVRNYQTGA